MADVGRSEEALIHLGLKMLRCECLIRKKAFAEAEGLLSELEGHFDRITSTKAMSGIVLNEEKWRARIARSRDALPRATLQ